MIKLRGYVFSSHWSVAEDPEASLRVMLGRVQHPLFYSVWGHVRLHSDLREVRVTALTERWRSEACGLRRMFEVSVERSVQLNEFAPQSNLRLSAVEPSA